MNHLNPDDEEESRGYKEGLAEIEEHKRLFAEHRSSTDKSEQDGIWARIKEIGEKVDSNSSLYNSKSH
jgi:hypothetical protein